MKEIIIWIIVTLVVVSGCASNKMLVTNSDGDQVSVKCQPIYGNWCGKGYPAYNITGFKPKPVDVWDEACMQHDFCYGKYDKEKKEVKRIGEEICDREFSQTLEDLDTQGIPAPHQIINAYNYFKENKPYRQIYISWEDIWNVNTLSCEGNEGKPTLFCDVGLGRDNCEISTGIIRQEGMPLLL